MRFRNSYLSIVFMAISGIGICQDTRNVREPKFPAVCHVLLADEKTLEDGTLAVFGNQDDESAADTKRLQAALDDCRPGLAVELSLGNAHRFDAFLIDPIRVPVGVSMIVDGGVTVFASSNPEHYQVLGATAQCGSVARVGGACQPLLLFQGDSGLYGYGVIDGRGYSKMTSGPNAGRAWWELTTSLRQGENQNIPELVTVDGNNFTIYKITLRHAPYYHLQWTGDGLIVWGLKIQSVWNVPNTDGINIWGTHATVRDSVISEGDDDIAIDARHIPAGQITIDNVTAYSRNGLSIGSGIAKGVANVLIENSHLTGGIVSLSGTSVNGVRLDDMKRLGVTEYQQALPSRAPNIRGLNIKTRPEAGGFARDITFENICIKDLNIPIEIAPYFGRTEGKKFRK